jgi:hypothetical protein
MAETIKLKVSQAVAAHLRPGLSVEERLNALECSSALEPSDRIMLLFCLMRDADAVVRGAVQTVFSSLPEEALSAAARSEDTHPAILDAITKAHHGRPEIAEALLGNERLSPGARSFLKKVVEQQPQAADETASAEETDDAEAMPPEEAETAEEETGEEFLSKYKQAQEMGIAEKIKMALTGDKEWRSILIKDANKLVSGGVIKNPRITEAEVLAVLKSGIQNDEIMRLICANKDWVKNYTIRKALVDNPRTPLPNALRYLGTLSDKDVAGYAKSKNVSSVISTQAKRLLLNKKR